MIPKASSVRIVSHFQYDTSYVMRMSGQESFNVVAIDGQAESESEALCNGFDSTQVAKFQSSDWRTTRKTTKPPCEMSHGLERQGAIFPYQNSDSRLFQH
jgi:hypothetical protein